MQLRNKKPAQKRVVPSTASRGVTFMLLSPGSQARRFQLTKWHVIVGAALWLVALALSFYLGFEGAAADYGATPKLDSAAPASVPS